MLRKVACRALGSLIDQELGDTFRQGLFPRQEVKGGQGVGLALRVLRHGGVSGLPAKQPTATPAGALRLNIIHSHQV